MAGDSALAPILVTDDESEDRFVLCRTLRKAGAAQPILEFRDGAELLEFLEAEVSQAKPASRIASVLFLDIKMPLVDGFDAMRWIRDNPVLKLLRIVIVSSSVLPQDRERATELGATNYLEKYPSAQTLAGVMTAGGAAPA